MHGLVAVHIAGAWHRQDPRGNKPGVNAQFSVGSEQLAWPVNSEIGERDYPQIFRDPSPAVVSALQQANSLSDLYRSGLPAAL